MITCAHAFNLLRMLFQNHGLAQEVIVHSANRSAAALTYAAHLTVWRAHAFLMPVDAYIWAPTARSK